MVILSIFFSITKTSFMVFIVKTYYVFNHLIHNLQYFKNHALVYQVYALDLINHTMVYQKSVIFFFNYYWYLSNPIMYILFIMYFNYFCYYIMHFTHYLL